ncbi:DUF418 domain-containing protein [Paenibacillus taiwanensis]|uniref:DUF418 domain-containing protein n=1 Tax=Paenibacillus taiwanensis TaxID=401638 RepID=UPI001FE1D42C|nr:DUF418 domain-containing protein [Paenibacillus taiwanensis]
MDTDLREKPASHHSQGKGRLIALDAARGLAVIGMFLQHFALNERNAFVAGNTTLLFVLCGGISYSIMAQRMKERGMNAAVFRSKMLARAVFVDVIGYSLILLNTQYGIILPAYAAMFVLALMLVYRSTRVLVYTTLALVLLAPPLMILGMSLLSGAYLLQDIAGGPMSALALAPAFTTGIVIGRLELTKKQVAMSLAIFGFIMLVIFQSMGTYVLPDLRLNFETWLVNVQGTSATPPDLYAIWPHNAEQPLWHMLLATAPHTASTFQTLIGLGIALLVVGLMFLVPRRMTVMLTPCAAVGRVALTMYALQFVVIWILVLLGIEYSLSDIPFGDLLIVVISLVIGWIFARLPNGPLESSMRRFDHIFSSFDSAPKPK